MCIRDSYTGGHTLHIVLGPKTATSATLKAQILENPDISGNLKLRASSLDIAWMSYQVWSQSCAWSGLHSWPHIALRLKTAKSATLKAQIPENPDISGNLKIWAITLDIGWMSYQVWLQCSEQSRLESLPHLEHWLKMLSITVKKVPKVGHIGFFRNSKKMGINPKWYCFMVPSMKMMLWAVSEISGWKWVRVCHRRSKTHPYKYTATRENLYP